MNKSSVTVGLDIGGTKIAAGLVEPEKGRVLVREVIPTLPNRGGEAVLRDALALTERLMTAAEAGERSVLGIGIGICELVDVNGNIADNYLIMWKDLPVRERFARLAPTIIESDARAPALAEAVYGAGKNHRLFAYITIGTGISYALIHDGKAFTGARGNAILLGSSRVCTLRDRREGRVGPMLEEVASGPALVARYNQKAGARLMQAQEVLAAATRGDQVAIDVVRSAGEALGQSVGFLINLLDPEALVVGGGLGLAGGLYWDCFVRTTRRQIYASDTRTLPIAKARLGTDAGIVGAAAVAMMAFGKREV